MDDSELEIRFANKSPDLTRQGQRSPQRRDEQYETACAALA